MLKFDRIPNQHTGNLGILRVFGFRCRKERLE